MADQFDPYHKWLGIPSDQRPPNHYQLLGVADFEDDLSVIESLADQRMAFVRSMQTGRHAEASQQILNELAAARVCLLNDAKRIAYNAELRKALDGGLSELLGNLGTKGTGVAAQRSAGRRKPRIIIPAVTLTSAVLILVLLIGFVMQGPSDSPDVNRGEQSGGDSGRGALPVSAVPASDDGSGGSDHRGSGDPPQAPIGEEGPVVAPDPEPAPGQWVDVFRRVDLSKHVVLGEWERQGREIHTSRALLESQWRFMVPVSVRDSYELHVEFTRIQGANIHVQLPVGDRGCTLILGGWNNTASGLHLIDGRKARDNPTARSPTGITNGRRYDLDVRVRITDDQAAIDVLLDGMPYVSWQGRLESLSVHADLALPVPDALGFGATNGTTLALHAARVRSETGQIRVWAQ